MRFINSIPNIIIIVITFLFGYFMRTYYLNNWVLNGIFFSLLLTVLILINELKNIEIEKMEGYFK